MCPAEPADTERDPFGTLNHEQTWLERFTLRLTRDPEAASEAVQETWLAVLQRGPRHGANVRGWLARVAHNAVRKARRGALHRTDRECAYGVGRDAERSEEDLERDERARIDLDDAVTSLSPDVQRAIVLRYVHGLTLREVGHELRLPLSTVDDRIRRGLRELRRRLGPERWASAVFGLLRPPRTSSASAPNLALVLASVCASCVALVATSAWLRPHSRVEPAREASLSQAGQVALIGAAPRVQRAELGVRSEASASRAVSGELIVAVHDHTGAALAGVHVRPLSLETGRRVPLPAGQRTDAGGHATWRDLAPGRYEVRADRFLVPSVEVAAGRATRVARRVSGMPLRGLVIDRNGHAVPGADVWLSAMPAGALREGRWVTEPVDAVAAATTDAYGRFTVAARGAAMRIGARAAGHAPSLERRVGASTAQCEDLVLELGGLGGAVEGRAVDHMGRPVEGAAVTATTLDPTCGGGALAVLSDVAGKFALAGLALGPCRLDVDAPGLQPWQRALVIEPGRPSSIDARLGAGAALTGRVVEADGRPAACVSVSAVVDSGGARAATDVRRTTWTDEYGAFVLAGLAPGSPTFEVQGDVGARELEVATRTRDGAFELVLCAERRATGRVVDEAGRPVTACVVRAQGASIWETVTAPVDGSGRFEITLPCKVSRSLAVIERGVPVHTIEEAIGRDVTIVLAERSRPNTRVRGRVVPPLGVALEVVTLELTDRCSGVRHHAELPLEDGRFVSQAVPSGDYSVSLSSDEAASAFDLDVHLTPHADVSLGTVALMPTVPCEWSIDDAGSARGLRAEVRRADGEPVRAWVLQSSSSSVTLSLRVLPGEYTWVVWSATSMPRAKVIHVAAPGSTERLTLEPGEPCVLVLSQRAGTPPSPALSVALVHGEEVVPFELHPSFREPGTPFVLEVGLAPGPHRLRVSGAVELRDADLSFEVTPGASLPRRIELPLTSSFAR